VTYRFTAELWEYPAEKASWFFVTLPTEVADEIEEAASTSRRGFGSVRVSVTIGSTCWATSLFPSKEAGSYLLPVKKAVRLAEGIDAGDPVEVEVEPQLD
jgi:hypothetical protein